MPHGRDRYEEKHAQTHHQPTHVGSPAHNGPWYRRFNGAHRAYSAKIQRKFGGEYHGNRDYEEPENPVLDEACPGRNVEFYVRYPIQKVLNEPKRTGPPAKDAPRYETGEEDAAYDGEGDEADPRELTHHTKRTREY
jgi:hypothetical protein